MGNERIKKKFDDIDEKIDMMMEYCRSLQTENKALLLKISSLEAGLDQSKHTESQFSEQEAFVQSKIEGLLTKLDFFQNQVKS